MAPGGRRSKPNKPRLKSWRKILKKGIEKRKIEIFLATVLVDLVGTDLIY